MAVQYANGKIVTDGLVLALNAADMNSYDYRENLVTYTSLIGGTGYSSAIGTGSITLTASLAPDGTNTATLISQSVSSDYVYGSNGGFTLVTSSIYTYSIFAKQGGKSNFTVTIDENGFGGFRYQFSHTFATNALSSTTIGSPRGGFIISSGSSDAGDGWRRIWGTFQTSTGSVGGFIDMIARFGSTGGTTFVWGRQLEKKPSPTPYTATTNTNITASRIFYDLSGNNYNPTSSIPQYNNSNGGSFYFPDNTSSTFLAPTFDFVPNGGVTMEAWVYPTSASLANGSGNSNGIMGIRSGSIIYSIGLWPQGPNASGVIQVHSSNATSGITYSIPNIWYHTLWTITTTTLLLYINGVLAYSTSGAYTLTPVTGGLASGTQVGRWIGGPGQPLYGNVAATKIYNRALSSQEVLQNYNAQKTRFGLT